MTQSIFRTEQEEAARVNAYVAMFGRNMLANDGARWIRNAFATPFAELAFFFLQQIYGIANLIQADKIPSAGLPHLGSRFGFDSALAISGQLTTAEWRRVLRSALAIWRTKGVPSSYRLIVHALTTQRCLVADLHTYSAAIGTDTLFQTWVDPGAPDYAEYRTWIWVPEVTRGQIDDSKLADALRPLKPALRQIDLITCDFFEDFTDGAYQWVIDGAHAVDDDAQTMTIGEDPGDPVLAWVDVGPSPLQWQNYRSIFQLSFTAEMDARAYVYAQNEDFGYYVQVTVATDTSGPLPAIQIVRVDAGTPTVIASGTLAGYLAAGYLYTLTVDVLWGLGTNVIRAWWQGDLVLSVLDGTYAEGRVGLRSDTDAPLTIHSVRVYQAHEVTRTEITA